MESNFIGYVVAFIVGAAVPIFINWLERKEKRKLFELERKDKYKLIAVEKRLEAHQKAFYYASLFLKAMDIKNSEEVKKIFKEAQKFYSNYSLYLNDNIRSKYLEALGFINAYCPRFEYLNKFPQNERQKALTKYFKEAEKIFELINIIFQEINLEPIALKPKFDVERNEIEPT